MDQTEIDEKKRRERVKNPPKKGASFLETDQYEFDKKKPERDAESLDSARKLMRRGLQGEQDIMSRFSPTMRKAATEDFKAGLERYEKPDTSATRNKQAYNEAGYKKGGVTRGDGIVKKGHTKGKML